MNVKSLKVIYIILLPFIGMAQRIGFDPIDAKHVSKWVTKSINEYQHAYHFGDSEAESVLVLLVVDTNVYAQIKSGRWTQDGTKWIWHYENLKNVSIKGNKFYSDKTNGEFVLYKNEDTKIQGLKVNKPWSGTTEIGEYEIGPASYKINDSFDGKYPQSSFSRLSNDELKKMSKIELKIMRNEIFARYGMIFKKSSEMDLYFKKQDWYQPQYKSVDQFLTQLEKDNLSIIKKAESEL